MPLEYCITWFAVTGCKFQKWHRKGGNKIKMHANEHCQLKWKSNEVKFLRNAFSMCFVCSDSKFVWKHVRTRCSSAIPISIETESTASDALIACNEKNSSKYCSWLLCVYLSVSQFISDSFTLHKKRKRINLQLVITSIYKRFGINIWMFLIAKNHNAASEQQ